MVYKQELATIQVTESQLALIMENMEYGEQDQKLYDMCHRAGVGVFGWE